MSEKLRVLAAASLLAVASLMDARAADEVSRPQAAAPIAPASAPAMTKQDVETFFDGLVPYALKRGDLAGAAVSVVKDGEVLFAKGYGYADIATRRPLTADRTLMRFASVSKVFTWTAVMQMVEQGKLDLDRDVNEYIDFRIPEKFGAPITMRHLMTHSAGFEDLAGDLWLRKPEQFYPLRDWLAKRSPERIFPPGKVVAYSNYGTALAGHIVERLSGEAFNDYIANHIFKPLRMEHSTFAQPLPEAWAPMMANGYRSASEGTPVPFELIEANPAGALTSTASDMARFMIAHLGQGRLGEVQILKPETVQLMHARNYTLAPGFNGFNLGFYDMDRNGRRVIGHSGDTVAFHSDLSLILDANVGLFISFNSLGKEGDAGRGRVAIFRAFLDRYFPYTAPQEPTVEAAKLDAQRVAGSYTFSRRIESAFRIISAITQTSVSAEPDGTIKVDLLRDLSGAPKTWRQIGPLTYREVGGQARLVFVADETGRILYFTSDDFIPVLLFQRTADLEQSSLFGPLTLGSLAVFVATLIIWIGGALIRRRYGARLALTPGQARLRLASRSGVVLFLAVVSAWLGMLVALSLDFALISSAELKPWMTAAYAVGVASILGGFAIIANAGRRLVGGPGGIIARGGELVLAAAAIYSTWAVINYGLVNFNTAF